VATDEPVASTPLEPEAEVAVVNAAGTVAASDANSAAGSGAEAAADCGLLVMIAGIVTMAVQGEGFIAEEFWRWGFLGAMIGGIAFAAGVLRLSTGAWRRSRDLEREIEALRGEVAKARVSAASFPAQPRSSLVGASGAFVSAPRPISSRAA